MELSPQLVTALLLSPVGSPLRKNGLPWGLKASFSGSPGSHAGVAEHWRELQSPAPGLRALDIAHRGARGACQAAAQWSACPLPSPESSLRASFPPASGGLSPCPLQLLQLLLLAAAGSAGRAPKRLGRRGRGRGGAGGGEEEEPAEAEEAQRRGDALREQGLAAAAALGDRTR